MRLSAKEIAKLMGISREAVHKRARKDSWPYTIDIVRGGRRHLFRLEDLPQEIRQKVMSSAVEIKSSNIGAKKAWSFRRFLKNLIELGKK